LPEPGQSVVRRKRETLSPTGGPAVFIKKSGEKVPSPPRFSRRGKKEKKEDL